MVSVEEYYHLPYSSQPEGWLELSEEELQVLSINELSDIMESEEYTKRTRFIAALKILSKG